MLNISLLINNKAYFNMNTSLLDSEFSVQEVMYF